jgi:pyruvate dehydrogenase E2 component (dihydrolipoamide acetyltransferase)
MAIEFKLPELGENVTSGDITRVLVKVGDAVKKDQPVLEMETGKATVEIPCPEAGVIKAIHVREGQKAAVGVLVLTLDPSGASAAPAPAAAAPKAAPAAPVAAPAPAPAPVARPAVRTVPPPAPAAPVVAGTGRAVPAAPSTRQFAREIGLDVAQVAGSGPGGRISVDDVKAHARAVMARGPAAGPAAPPALPDFGKYGAIERQALSNVRQATAQAMAISWSNVPRVVLHDKADITDLEKFRQDSKGRADKAGAKLTLTAFLIKICGSALKQFPQFNASLDLAANELVLKKYVNIGVAMDTEKGLVVPVIRGVDGKNVLQVAGELGQLAERAKAKKIGLEDMQGGCFSVTNLGSIGVGFFSPIVNFPEVAILGVGRAVQEPVMVNGFFQPRLMMPLSLAFDHRVIDGADGARFLRWIIEAIQQPALLTLEG